MKEFLLLFRQPDYDYSRTSHEKMQALGQKWHKWIYDIVAQDKFVGHEQRLSREGKVLRPGGVITDGPFVEIREKLGGSIVIKAENIEEATTLAHGCPALDEGGSVEIRLVQGNWQGGIISDNFGF
jgi:hypothetical protein